MQRPPSPLAGPQSQKDCGLLLYVTDLKKRVKNAMAKFDRQDQY